MQYGWNVLIIFGAWIVGLVLSAGLIIGVGAGGLWFLKRTVGAGNYASVTLLLAVVGGMFGIYQGSRSLAAQRDEKARMLAAASTLTSSLWVLASTDDLPGGKTGNVQSMRPELVALKIARMEATSKALDQIELKGMPSAVSMGALVRARGGAASMLGRAQYSITNKVAVDFDRDIAELGNASIDFDAELKRLYPVYGVGPIAIGTPAQYR